MVLTLSISEPGSNSTLHTFKQIIFLSYVEERNDSVYQGTYD